MLASDGAMNQAAKAKLRIRTRWTVLSILLNANTNTKRIAPHIPSCLHRESSMCRVFQESLGEVPSHNQSQRKSARTWFEVSVSFASFPPPTLEASSRIFVLLILAFACSRASTTLVVRTCQHPVGDETQKPANNPSEAPEPHQGMKLPWLPVSKDAKEDESRPRSRIPESCRDGLLMLGDHQARTPHLRPPRAQSHGPHLHGPQGGFTPPGFGPCHARNPLQTSSEAPQKTSGRVRRSRTVQKGVQKSGFSRKKIEGKNFGCRGKGPLCALAQKNMLRGRVNSNSITSRSSTPKFAKLNVSAPKKCFFW
eukprot:jgi/Bigna1/66646/fgenesh1_pg.2_\